MKRGRLWSSPGAGAGADSKSLGGLRAAYRELRLGVLVFSRGASWLIVIKMGLFGIALKAGEEIGGFTGLWSILRHLKQVLPGYRILE